VNDHRPDQIGRRQHAFSDEAAAPVCLPQAAQAQPE
jgi:hypothetical protein